MDLNICPDSIPTFLNAFDLSIAPPLLFYAYVPAILLSLFLGVYVLIKDRYSLQSKLLLGISLSFSIWVLNLMFQWTIAYINVDMFSWQVTPYFEVLIPIFSIYFVYVFLYKQDIPVWGKISLSAVLISIALLLPSKLNVTSFDYIWCEANYGQMYYYFIYVFELFAILATAYIGFNKYFKTDKTNTVERSEALFLTLSSTFFLTIFYLSNILGEVTQVYTINLFGPIGIVIFLGTLAYMIVKFHRFNTKIAAPTALVLTLWVLVSSLLFVNTIDMVRLIVAATLVMLVGFSIALIKSIKREIKQKEEIESLAEQLKKANVRLRKLDQLKSEFVSIASHQLKSPLTAIRGYASLILEGSFGKIPKKATEAISNIHESSRLMALSIEDFLNVSRIEQGKMKYDLVDFDIKGTAEKIVDELRPTAIKKGLLLTFKSDCTSGCIVHADVGKVYQVLHNLIDNSVKYTPEGKVVVTVRDDVKKKKVYVSVTDTGVGMSETTIEEIFQKFIRARNAHKVNVSGSGLGLYVAHQMVEKMGGGITAESEGEGKGSTFTLELPLVH